MQMAGIHASISKVEKKKKTEKIAVTTSDATLFLMNSTSLYKARAYSTRFDSTRLPFRALWVHFIVQRS